MIVKLSKKHLVILGVMGVATVAYDLVWAAVLWLVVAAVAAANHGHVSRQPLPRGMSSRGRRCAPQWRAEPSGR